MGKKLVSLSSRVEVLVLVIAICSAALAATALAADVGDCTQTTPEDNADCDNAQDCGVPGCRENEASISCPAEENVPPLPTPGRFLLSNIRKFGKCTNGNWDYGCISCGFYYCAQANAYLDVDENGQCQWLLCSAPVGIANACVPVE